MLEAGWRLGWGPEKGSWQCIFNVNKFLNIETFIIVLVETLHFVKFADLYAKRVTIFKRSSTTSGALLTTAPLFQGPLRLSFQQDLQPQPLELAVSEVSSVARSAQEKVSGYSPGEAGGKLEL